MNIYGKSDIGLKRTSNQDCFDYGKINDGMTWAVVCDGMGGANGGDIASSLATQCIKNFMTQNYTEGIDSNEIKELLKNAIYKANCEILNKANKNKDLLGMGTTVVLVAIYKNKIHISHVGDSRAYLLSKDNIKQLTVDHSMVQQMIDDGEITHEQAKSHPNKNIITRALGINKNVEIDYFETIKNKEKSILICTDGLTNCISEKEILNCYLNNPTENVVDQLITLANKNGGSDNITVIILSEK